MGKRGVNAVAGGLFVVGGCMGGEQW
jgi:hypothetical protein